MSTSVLKGFISKTFMGVTWFWNPNCFCDFGLKSRCWYALCCSRHVWLLCLIRQDFSDPVWLCPCPQIQICPSTQAQVKIRRLSLVPPTNIIPISQTEKVRLREVKQLTSMTTALLLNGRVKFQICFPLTSKSLYLGSLSSFKDTAFWDQLDLRTQKLFSAFLSTCACMRVYACTHTHTFKSISFCSYLFPIPPSNYGKSLYLFGLGKRGLAWLNEVTLSLRLHTPSPISQAASGKKGQGTFFQIFFWVSSCLHQFGVAKTKPLHPSPSSPASLPCLQPVVPQHLSLHCSLHTVICILWPGLGQSQSSSFQFSPSLALPWSFHMVISAPFLTVWTIPFYSSINSLTSCCSLLGLIIAATT